MDQVRRDAAIRKLERARERAGRARVRAIVLPIAMFGVVWAAVFAQMATGNDPALSTASGPASAGRTTVAASGAGSATPPKPQQQATVLAYDPVSGTIVRVPASSAVAAPAPAPAPAPVTTSQS